MRYKCIIIDDEKLGRDLIKTHMSQFPYLELAGEYSSGMEAMRVLSNEKIDIVFLDINMPQLSGIELLRQNNNMPLTILCTAYSEYALESYDLDVVDYLLKPISFPRFSKAVGKAIARLRPSESVTSDTKQDPVVKKPTYIFVKSDYKNVKIYVEDIQYIQAMEKYIRIFTADKKIMTLMSMSNILDALPASDFLRIHRSYIVNISKIGSTEGNMVIVADEKLPVSKGNRKTLKTRLNLA